MGEGWKEREGDNRSEEERGEGTREGVYRERLRERGRVK